MIVPARFTPLGDRTFVNLTPTVHDAPGARLAPVQVFCPATALKKLVSRVPPVTETPVTATDVPPTGAVLVRLTIPVPVRTPVGKVIVSGFGAIETVPRVVTPVPVSVTGDPVTVAPV